MRTGLFFLAGFMLLAVSFVLAKLFSNYFPSLGTVAISQAYGADCLMASPAATARWLESDRVQREWQRGHRARRVQQSWPQQQSGLPVYR